MEIAERCILLVGVLIRCLAKLCESEVLDLLSTWSALSKHFAKESRQPVLKSYCCFISIVSKLDEHYKYLASANPAEVSIELKRTKLISLGSIFGLCCSREAFSRTF